MFPPAFSRPVRAAGIQHLKLEERWALGPPPGFMESSRTAEGLAGLYHRGTGRGDGRGIFHSPPWEVFSNQSPLRKAKRRLQLAGGTLGAKKSEVPRCFHRLSLRGKPPKTIDPILEDSNVGPEEEPRWLRKHPWDHLGNDGGRPTKASFVRVCQSQASTFTMPGLKPWCETEGDDLVPRRPLLHPLQDHAATFLPV
ncbi:hypothetical protein GWK47_030792 [Chionoecetes opilio]|uniref:Uncharacterized protein n=1 Tax=Chionoecetes opilio TaxID=41210 RepID=A0A8J5CQV7_CHIOP|nr:hypothetical protein GWK47_030792 [Chionoecetes opilio]